MIYNRSIFILLVEILQIKLIKNKYDFNIWYHLKNIKLKAKKLK